jgi:thymidylate synthase
MDPVLEKFQPVFVMGRTINDTWFELLTQLWDKGRRYKVTSGSYAGSSRLEFDFVAGTIISPSERPLAVYTPPGVPAPTTDSAIEEYFVNYLMNGQLSPNEHYRYSTWIVGGKYKIPQIRIEGKDLYDPEVTVPNQLQWCIEHFKKQGFGNNHCTIQVGYPETNLAYDIPYSEETERRTAPCLRLIDLKIIEQNQKSYSISMVCYFRSWDLYGGFPENIGGLTLLLEYVANELTSSEIEVIPGSLSFVSKGLHCYDFQIEAVRLKLNKK